LKVGPIVIAAGLSLGITGLAALLTSACNQLLHTPSQSESLILWLYLDHTIQVLLALVAVAYVKSHLPADYGLHWPREKTYIGVAITWGIVLGASAFLVGAVPQLLAHKHAVLGYESTTPNLLGWLFFEGVYVGPTEEIPFRALAVTYLATAMPGQLRLGPYKMNGAGIIVAILFALGHADSFRTEPLVWAMFQQGFALAWGIIYAYLLQKSGSVVAPAIAHNVGDLIPTVGTILRVWFGV